MTLHLSSGHSISFGGNHKKQFGALNVERHYAGYPHVFQTSVLIHIPLAVKMILEYFLKMHVAKGCGHKSLPSYIVGFNTCYLSRMTSERCAWHTARLGSGET